MQAEAAGRLPAAAAPPVAAEAAPPAPAPTHAPPSVQPAPQLVVAAATTAAVINEGAEQAEAQVEAPALDAAAVAAAALGTSRGRVGDASPFGEGHTPPHGLHHLTRHWLPDEARGEAVLQRLGAPDMRSAEQMIR